MKKIKGRESSTRTIEAVQRRCIERGITAAELYQQTGYADAESLLDGTRVFIKRATEDLLNLWLEDTADIPPPKKEEQLDMFADDPELELMGELRTLVARYRSQCSSAALLRALNWATNREIEREPGDINERISWGAEPEVDAITQYYADSRRGDRRYTPARIAWELERTAMGDGHYGNALRVAKDLECVDAVERSLLDRWATGKQGGTDHIALQELALKIDKHYGEGV